VSGIRSASWLVPAAALALGGCTMKEMIYPAPPVRVPSPPAPLEEVRLEVGDRPAIGWHLPTPAESTGPAVLFFHGNGENLQTMRLSGTFEQLATLGVPVLALDYPGYGRSAGEPSETNLMNAAAAALDWLEAAYPERPKVAVGWSLGAAVAVGLTAREPERIDGLVALSAWSSLPAVAERHFPRMLVGLLLRERYDSLAAAQRIGIPALGVHGTRDEIIPVEQGRSVNAALGADAEWLEIESAGHNDLLSHPPVWEAIRAFLTRL
jgi:pimeloyl-ACP methyl ester carboxylesterase